LLGLTLAAIVIEESPVLSLSEGQSYIGTITIVGVEKTTEQGQLAVVSVELKSGSGDVLIKVPPYENEDTQQAAISAKVAAASLTRRSLSTVDLVVSIENVDTTTTIAGPSASSAVALLMVSVIRASENTTPNRVRENVVVSANIDSGGRLSPVGDIDEKYQTVKESGGYSTFIVAETQAINFNEDPSLEIVHVRNLQALVNLVLW
jgi:predicted S18 family serine protease